MFYILELNIDLGKVVLNITKCCFQVQIVFVRFQKNTFLKLVKYILGMNTNIELFLTLILINQKRNRSIVGSQEKTGTLGGPFCTEKNPTLAIRIWRRLYRDYPDWEFVIVGYNKNGFLAGENGIFGTRNT